jgi:dolichyl-phosphate beta-glucosyltransferase
MRPPLVHLVIPAFNEGRRLPVYLPQLYEALSELPFSWRITVIDDGSRDEDSRRMQECARLCGARVEFYRLPVNLGKGGAVYSGWNSDHESEWLGLLDADGSIPPHEVVRLLNSLGQDDAPDAFFASRCKILGRTVQRSWRRHVGRTRLRDACFRCNRNSRVRFTMRLQVASTAVLRGDPEPSPRKAIRVRRRTSSRS